MNLCPRLKLLTLAVILLPVAAIAQNTATITGHLADPGGTAVASRVFVRAELKNSGGQVCKVSGVALINPYVRDFQPNATGDLSFSIYKNSAIVCGNTSGASQWSFSIWRDGHPAPACALQITADTNLNSATCLNATATPVIPLPADGVFLKLDGTNGPVTGTLSWNALQTFVAGIVSGGSINAGANAISGGAISGSSVAATGTVTGSNIPASIPGVGSCTNQFVTALNALGAPTCATDVLASAQHANQGTTTTVLHGNAAGNPSFGSIVSGDLAASLGLVTPNIGVAAGSSLNLNAAAAGTGAVLTVGGTSSTTGGISVFVGAPGSATERFSVVPADGSSAATRVGALSVRTPGAGFLTGAEVASISSAGAIVGTSASIGGAVAAKTLNTAQNVAKYATGGSGTSVSPWTSASGTGGCQEAVNALGANGGNVVFTEGFYSFTNTTTGCVAADNVTFDSVGRSAIIQAGANNAVFFSDSTHANFARFFNLTLDGNAFTGVKGIDLTTARFGVTIRDVNFNNMNQGFVSTTGQFAAEMRNVSFRAITAPINIVANSSSLKMDYITIDNENFVPTVACTNGINIQSGTLSNLGNYLNGGFVQGCATGLLDQAVGLTVVGTYFEDNTVADISCSGAFNSHYIHTNHWGAVGPVAIKGRTCTGAKIDNPIMGSGARVTGLFDWDGTNTQSVAEYIVNGSSMNTPTGTTTGLTGATLHVGTFQTTAGSKAITAYGYIGSPNFGTYLRAGELEDSISGAAIRHLDGNGEALDGFLGFVNGQVDSILPDAWISRCAAGCVGIGNATGVGNVGGELRAAKVTVNGDTSYTSAPRFTLGGFIAGMNTGFNVSQTTPDRAITLTRIEAVATVITACTVNPTITVTNGTNTATLTLTTGAAKWDSGAISTAFAAGAPINIVSATTGTCTTAPVNINVTAEFKMQ
jgi:hypothetical protein